MSYNFTQKIIKGNTMKTKQQARQSITSDDKLMLELEWLIQNPKGATVDVLQLTVASAKHLQRQLNDIFGQVTITGGLM